MFTETYNKIKLLLSLKVLVRPALISDSYQYMYKYLYQILKDKVKSDVFGFQVAYYSRCNVFSLSLFKRR